MRVVTSFSDTRSASDGVVALVPTMGYLHEGHLALIAAARSGAETVVVSLFVNPLQFGDADDLEEYPRSLDRDTALAASAGADILFVPSVAEMYPAVPRTRVVVREVAEGLEGDYRPGHFEGVATIVAKLLAGIRPDVVCFGRKDAQQLAVVERLIADMSFPVDVVPVSTVRENDGLALSSRNVFLSEAERSEALGISAGLMKAADLAEDGETDGSVLIAAVRSESDLDFEYVELVEPETFAPVYKIDGRAVLAAAARVGKTRLIDNVGFDSTPSGMVADRGTRLESQSILYEKG